MKLKRILAAVCAAGVALCLAGCGNSDTDKLLESLTAGTSKPASSSTKKPTSVSTSSKRESEPTVSEPTSEPVEVSEPTSEPTVVSEPISEPTVGSEPTSEATTVDDTLNLENCPELQSLIHLDRGVSGAEIKAFAEKYKGKTIELEMLTAFVENNKNYKTRFNYLLYAVQDGNVMLAGPSFAFEDVNYYDLNLTGDNIPDTFGITTHCLVKAEIDGYNSNSEWILLDPVSIEVIKIYE